MAQALNTFIFWNGILDLFMVFTHVVFDISWWSRLNVDKSYICPISLICSLNIMD